MRKTLDLLTIIRKLNHPMIKQVIPRPRNISTLWHVSVSLLHKMLLRIKIFSSVQSWDLDIRDMMEVEALEMKLNSPKAGLDSWVWWQVSWSRMMITKDSVSLKEFTVELSDLSEELKSLLEKCWAVSDSEDILTIFTRAENHQHIQFKSLSSKNRYSNVKPSFFLWPHFSKSK